MTLKNALVRALGAGALIAAAAAPAFAEDYVVYDYYYGDYDPYLNDDDWFYDYYMYDADAYDGYYDYYDGYYDYDVDMFDWEEDGLFD